MPDKGFVNFEDRIPVYVSGFGPKSLGLAGKHGDGAVFGHLHNPGILEHLWPLLETGAAVSGRKLDRNDFYATMLTTIVVLEEGESVLSERVKAQCGAMAIASVHFAYDQWRNFGKEPPAYMAEIWADYTTLLEKFPEQRRHQRIHAGHNCWVLPEEEQFLTEQLLRCTCLIGTRDELKARVNEYEVAGINQLMVLPNFDTRYEVLQAIADHLM
jgi:alkanesulfonate monooxygenase SsuD/methylene tetrahydromethanopterin reductase-like flavin-dependent oxidoreductase (luciferase family)